MKSIFQYFSSESTMLIRNYFSKFINVLAEFVKELK